MLSICQQIRIISLAPFKMTNGYGMYKCRICGFECDSQDEADYCESQHKKEEKLKQKRREDE